MDSCRSSSHTKNLHWSSRGRLQHQNCLPRDVSCSKRAVSKCWLAVQCSRTFELVRLAAGSRWSRQSNVPSGVLNRHRDDEGTTADRNEGDVEMGLLEVALDDEATGETMPAAAKKDLAALERIKTAKKDLEPKAPEKPWCCPKVGPTETVTACCPRMVLYLWFVVPKIWARNETFGLISVAVVLWFWTTLFVTSCTNPGILMKHNEPDPDSTLRGLKMCNKCKLYQPKETSHCRDCGVCVYGYDHHCGFMGQCIGGLNLWAFYCFLINIIVTVVYMLITMQIALHRKRHK